MARKFSHGPKRGATDGQSISVLPSRLANTSISAKENGEDRPRLQPGNSNHSRKFLHEYKPHFSRARAAYSPACPPRRDRYNFHHLARHQYNIGRIHLHSVIAPSFIAAVPLFLWPRNLSAR